MAELSKKKLIIKQRGQILQEIDLKPEQEYSIGRGSDNAIVLPDQAGLSRKHLSLRLGEDNQWLVKNLSSTEDLIIDGEGAEEGIVPLGGTFQTQDFEFILKEVEQKSKAQSKKKDKNLPSSSESGGGEQQSVELYKKTESKVKSESELGQDKGQSVPADSSADLPALSDDKTKILSKDSSSLRMSAYLKVSEDTGGARDIFKLEEDQSEWILGREGSADIVVDNPNISRNHFKIIQKEQDYFIEDLKSSNGTILNDKDLRPGKSYALQSGDMIYILDSEIVFEVKNLSLEKELAQIKAPPPVPAQKLEGGLPVVQGPPGHGWPVSYGPRPADVPGVIVEGPEESSTSFSFVKKNKKRVALYGSLLLVGALFLFFNTESSTKEEEENKENSEVVAGEEGLAGLSAQQVSLVENTYMAARLLFSQGKFDLCSSEIKKIHKYTDSYQDSKKLEIACTQAMENQKRQYDLEYKKKQAEKTDQFIQKVTDQCREKFDSFKFKYELVACLNSAIELSPADGRIQALTDQFDTNEALEEEAQRQKAERRQFIKSISSKYHHAKSLHKKGQVLKAMSAYQRFISVSGHQELKQQRATARRELASIKQEFQDKNQKMESVCKSHFSAKKFKTAYYACDKAVDKIPPPHNKNARLLRDKAQNQLELIMKPLYEEANLNESIGNVLHAQEFWKKILELDVSTGLYYKRAKDKLSKY